MNKRIIPPAPRGAGEPDAQVRQIVRNLRRVAVVGMPDDLSSPQALAAVRLLAYDFQFFPVHSDCGHALGHGCVPHLHDVESDVDIVQVLPNSGVSSIHLAKEAIRKRPKVFWMEDAPLDAEVAELLTAEGIEVVTERKLEAEFFRLAG
jgi:predicted CoA-binding protein